MAERVEYGELVGPDLIEGSVCEATVIEVIRDLSIIVLALETFVVNVILVLLLWQIRNMVIVLREESKPVLRSTQETTETLRNTSQFMSNHVARPLINVMSFASGLRGAAKSLGENLGSPRPNGDDKLESSPPVTEIKPSAVSPNGEKING
ncbi:MAG: hypothetical protein J5I90_21840 [Caldilineales bacterium]|nr:hypothetical protein [Caldilineales bacterium]